jgi:hypothetical protein
MAMEKLCRVVGPSRLPAPLYLKTNAVNVYIVKSEPEAKGEAVHCKSAPEAL